MAGTGNPPPRKTTKAPTRQMWRRSIITLVIIIGFCFTAVVGKMGVLMIAEGEDWQQRAVSQRMSDSITTYSKEALLYQAVAETLDIVPTQEQIDTYSSYTDTYGENYCTMVALMDAVTDALTESAVVS